MSRWFRFYDDAINDPKVLKLSDKLYRLWVGILCVASKNNGELPPLNDLALLIRIKGKKLEPMIKELIKSGLIDDDGVSLKPHNWDGRQYKSDVSTERVKRFRSGKRNVSETPPDTEAETETETEKKEERSLRSRANEVPHGTSWPKDYRDRFWNAYPRKKAKQAAFKALERIRREGKTPFDSIMAGIQKIPKAEPQFIPHPATWLNQGRWEDEVLPGENDGYRGSRALQDDSRSVSKALDRLGEQNVEFTPRPRLFSSEGESDLRLLPAGRGTGPGDLRGGTGAGVVRISELDSGLRGGPKDGGGDQISDGAPECGADQGFLRRDTG